MNAGVFGGETNNDSSAPLFPHYGLSVTGSLTVAAGDAIALECYSSTGNTSSGIIDAALTALQLNSVTALAGAPHALTQQTPFLPGGLAHKQEGKVWSRSEHELRDHTHVRQFQTRDRLTLSRDRHAQCFGVSAGTDRIEAIYQEVLESFPRT